MPDLSEIFSKWNVRPLIKKSVWLKCSRVELSCGLVDQPSSNQITRSPTHSKLECSTSPPPPAPAPPREINQSTAAPRRHAGAELPVWPRRTARFPLSSFVTSVSRPRAYQRGNSRRCVPRSRSYTIRGGRGPRRPPPVPKLPRADWFL